MRKLRHVSVGINAYPSAPLSGCVNDALDWEAELTRRGSIGGQVLLDTDATLANVVAALERLVAETGWGDAGVFTFSGHGTWVPDGDGDEPDGRDEALCCFDYDRAGLLTDDQIAEIVSGRRRGSRLYLVSDSCHSGSVSRFAPPVGGISDGTPRYLPPVEALPPGLMPAARRVEGRPARGRSRETGVVLLSGCADPEYSYDATIGGRPRGAFTAAALDALAEGPASVRGWHSGIRRRLPSALYPQTPQLGGSAARLRRRPF